MPVEANVTLPGGLRAMNSATDVVPLCPPGYARQHRQRGGTCGQMQELRRSLPAFGIERT